MASINVKSGGVFRQPGHIWIKSGGVWRDCQSVWAKSGGTWRQVFSLGGINTSFLPWTVLGQQTAGTPGASGTLSFNSNGTVSDSASAFDSSTPGSSNWYNPTTTSVGNTYWIRATATTGTVTTGTVGSWLQLSSTRSWTKSTTGTFGSGTVTLTFEIATDSGGSTIVFTSTGNVISYDHGA